MFSTDTQSSVPKINLMLVFSVTRRLICKREHTDSEQESNPQPVEEKAVSLQIMSKG